MKEKPKTIGERSEACILAALLKAGKTVLIPFGDNQRYDLVIEEDNNFTRVQCKTGRLKNGSVGFPVTSRAGGIGTRKSYDGEIDVFGVYCPELDKVYIVPLIAGYKSGMHLRVSKTKIKQRATRQIRWAKDYELV